MDPASCALNITTATSTACAQIWQLSEVWGQDGPSQLSQLRTELAQANEFFGVVQLAVADQTLPRTADWVGQLTYELEECCHKAEASVRGFQQILGKLLDKKYESYGVVINNKRRRAVWLRNMGEMARLRSLLEDAMLDICAILSMLDSLELLEVESPLQVMEVTVGKVKERDSVAQRKATALGLHGVQHVIPGRRGRSASISSEHGSPHQVTTSLALVRSTSPDTQKTRKGEHRRPSIPDSIYRTSACQRGCICTCHSTKNWGRLTIQTSFLGTLMISYRGIAPTRAPTRCSNPLCQTSRYPPPKSIRMDIQPPLWLLRATISVFFSFGLPNPELVLRVASVTATDDVHSSMNHLLWAVQRGDVIGVKHFLGSRLVRSDDFYGPAENGFTPLRLALDKRNAEMATLLYHGGGDFFHGTTLQTSAASSLLIWLEQEPAEAEFLAEHFPLTSIIEEAEYTTLHKIIIGLLHLDLHEALQAPEILALVNTPNAFGRTPLHLAALRGNAPAITALLDAGADLNARGNHAKHALHYACKAGSLDAVNTLLARGAPLLALDNLARTPLFDAVGYGSNTQPGALITHLLTRDIIRTPSDWVTTTLLALSNRRTAALRCLLPFWPRDTAPLPLYPAIHIGFPDGVRLLLAHGADWRVVDAYGEGICHWLAGSGVEMLRLFVGLGVVSGVDVGRKDHRGKTARDILEERWDLTEGFRREFLAFLETVGEAEEVREIEEADERDSEVEECFEDEFHDAMETFDPTPANVAAKDDRTSPVGSRSPTPDPGSRPLFPTSEETNAGFSAADDAQLSKLETVSASVSASEDHALGSRQKSDPDEMASGGAVGPAGLGSETDTGQSSPGETNKVLVDEGRVKSLGTAASLRG